MRIALIPALFLTWALPARAQEPDLGTEAQREAGRVTYEARCAHCHGLSGDGQGPATSHLRPAPRDFTASIFKFRSSLSGELPTDADLRRSIREGMPYTGMPPWPSLSKTEVTNLIYYIKTFSDDFSGPFGIPETIELPEAPAMTDASVERGREVFLENQCTDCHGMFGRGDGTSAPTLTDQWGYHIRPADLTKRWTFRGGSTREDIYRTFMTGLDGSPMPSYDIEPPEDRWALVDYVYSLSRDEPGYASSMRAAQVADPVSDASFDAARPAYFPVVGQVIEPRRAFFPGVNGISARAVVSPTEIAIRLTWNDMIADTDGRNAPDAVVPAEWSGAPDTSGTWSDAVAVQFPSDASGGIEKPYFLFGDRKAQVDLWFVDLGAGEATHYLGRGSSNLSEDGPPLRLDAQYEAGAWTVTLRRDREVEGHVGFPEGEFIPIAFSVWDGFNAEAGSRRGVTGWYHVYVDVTDRPSPVLPVLGYGLATLLLGLSVTAVMRWRFRKA